ncbi:MAG: hypothetical protein K0R09_953 [Clostridiales bacterium]|jgi:RNA polymerase subunit RPABC4/transcription elongation factor Spt4|nr:hypothetical protein [Clostridiales bacterium]
MSKFTVLLVFPAVLIVIAQGTWIFLDARKRGEKYYWLWGLLGLIQFPSSLIIYLLVMGITHEKCKYCGKGIKKGGRLCPYCGNKLRESCPNCGIKIEKDWKFCPECNNSLKEKQV